MYPVLNPHDGYQSSVLPAECGTRENLFSCIGKYLKSLKKYSIEHALLLARYLFEFGYRDMFVMLKEDLMSSVIEVLWLQVHMPHLSLLFWGVAIGHSQYLNKVCEMYVYVCMWCKCMWCKWSNLARKCQQQTVSHRIHAKNIK